MMERIEPALSSRKTVVDISLSFLQSETLGREHKRTHFWREDTRTAQQARSSLLRPSAPDTRERDLPLEEEAAEEGTEAAAEGGETDTEPAPHTQSGNSFEL